MSKEPLSKENLQMIASRLVGQYDHMRKAAGKPPFNQTVLSAMENYKGTELVRDVIMAGLLNVILNDAEETTPLLAVRSVKGLVESILVDLGSAAAALEAGFGMPAEGIAKLLGGIFPGSEISIVEVDPNA